MTKDKKVLIFRHKLELALYDYSFADLVLLKPIFNQVVDKVLIKKRKEYLKNGKRDK